MYKLKIKEFRKLKKISQEKLAFRIGISQNFLSELENQKYDIKLSMLFQIGDALDVCPKNLFVCNFQSCRKRKRKGRD